MTDHVDKRTVRGRIFYDADCGLCVRWMRRVRRLFEVRGFRWTPLQTPGTAAQLGVSSRDFHYRMHVLWNNGRLVYNADAVGGLCRSVWWLWPLGVLIALPGFKQLARCGYDWIARNRYCLGGRCHQPRPVRPAETAYLPLLLLPLLAGLLTWNRPSWVFMWSLAFALFAGCKWMTYDEVRRRSLNPAWYRKTAYLFAWPGMGAARFLGGTRPDPPSDRALGIGLLCMSAGSVCFWGLGAQLLTRWPLAAGWAGMVGVVLSLHFGIFAVIAWGWQRTGVDVIPLMRNPVAAASLSEFWSSRWNTAFHELARRLVFRPLRRRVPTETAMLATFLVSGLVHDLLISVPARGGYGLPTLYFCLQGTGVLLQRSVPGELFGLSRGFRGRVFTLIVVAGPIGLLFHPLFVFNVILPFMRALGATH